MTFNSFYKWIIFFIVLLAIEVKASHVIKNNVIQKKYSMKTTSIIPIKENNDFFLKK